MKDEQGRVLLTSMVACLFARGVYKDELLAECLDALGYTTLAGNLQQVAQHVQKMSWQLRLSTGFDPQAVKIPRRFTEVKSWKGKVDEKFLNDLMKAYANRILDIAKDEEK